MSSTSNNVVITLIYEDYTTRIYTLEDVSADLEDIKLKILQINENANNQYENFYKTFVSPNGYAVTKIESCKVVQTVEEVIYSG